jgi:hypothetical protein
MHGEWILKMDISRPQRDTIIHKIYFGAAKDGDHNMPMTAQ